MGDFFNRLQDEMENKEKEAGISAVDLLDLPLKHRLIMRFMLRAVVISQLDIIKEVKGWKGEKEIPEPDFMEAIESLIAQGFLILLGEPDAPNYRVNLGRKRASTLDSNIWGKLESKLDNMEKKEDSEKDENK
ncbi:MAG: hypothetical protein N2D54_06295 [Chloroflexota bacterium]